MSQVFFLWNFNNGAVSFRTAAGRPSGNLNKAIRYDSLPEVYTAAKDLGYRGVSRLSVTEEGVPTSMTFHLLETP